MNQQKKIIIAIDGYSSCGKSTMAKAMAKILQYSYIDTGAMYRAVTLFALQNKLVLNNQVLASELVKHLGQIEISFRFNVNTQQSDTYLIGKNVESEIRGMEVASFVSPVATIKEVRVAMVLQQQAMGIEKGIVMDGRDIGTVVFPDAELKIFMTADPEIRAKRRFDEMLARGEAASYESILANVLERDHIDRSRAESPLMQAADALVLDNSFLSQTEQLDWALLQVKRILNDN